MLIESLPKPRPQEVSHNLLGQRLGRKGLETRERILRAALCLLDKPQQDAPITLSSVAREASVGMTTLYLYFPDLGDLVLAALNRVMEAADEAFLDRLRIRWPDEHLDEHCRDFLRAHYLFWHRHARILHLRNSFADAGDQRFVDYRNRVSYPLSHLLLRQTDSVSADASADNLLLATVMLTGFERLATVITTANFHASMKDQGVSDESAHIDRLLCAEARLITLGIRDARAKSLSHVGATAHAACQRR
ncbi:TetR/AcrR family transcriptional regulator [Sphingomonas bacterium]|uniref:TetR/AcrR family transcriptional regulator n=1 Tax=Sphingomonas bacterium TaxID=1895847 RepID=UPI001C2D6DC5|nr:TetR/AcrR family transcriptional regulator [Sphingomonas bacterium]